MNAPTPDNEQSQAITEHGEGRTLGLLRRIESGTLDPKCISIPERRQLVAFLLGDGCSTAEMAQILKVNDRTIERDKNAIREANAIARNPNLVPQMVGRLVGEAELSVQRIRKAVRDKAVAPAVRVDAEHRCYQIVSDLVRSMQRLGYLPTAAQKVEADLTHHAGTVPDFDTMKVEVGRLKEIGAIQDGSSETETQLQQLEGLITQADLAKRIEHVTEQTASTEGEDDE